MQAHIWVVPRAPRVRLRQAAVVAATLAYLSAYAAVVLAGLTFFAETQAAALWETSCAGLLLAVALTLWRCDVRRSRNRPDATVKPFSARQRSPRTSA